MMCTYNWWCVLIVDIVCCWLRACSFNPFLNLKGRSTSLFHTVKDMSVGLISERIEKQQSVKISCFNVSLQQVQISSVKRCLFFQVQEKAVALTDRINTPSASRSLWFLIAVFKSLSRESLFRRFSSTLFMDIYICLDPAFSHISGSSSAHRDTYSSVLIFDVAPLLQPSVFRCSQKFVPVKLIKCS